MDIREAVKSKENYGAIAAYFKALDSCSMDQLVLLIDTIEQMSPEIYEHYRALQEIFKREIRACLDGKMPEDTQTVAYLIAKGCSTGTLLAEKYERYL